MRINLFRRSMTAVLALGAFLTAQKPAVASHAWGNYHWARTANPFTIVLGDNVSATWDAHLTLASSDWSQSTVLDTLVKSGNVLNTKNCKPTAGRVEVCNSSYGNNGWLGIAQIWISGGHITQGIVKLNDYYFNQPRYNTPAWRQFVTCQEVGHTFGLGHQDENFNNTNLGSCMDYTSDPTSNQHPNQHDYAQLESIYSHLDSTTTIGNAVPPQGQPPAMTDLELTGPAQWGKLVASSKNGRLQVFEADFGHGHKIITFVTWADGVERGRGE